MTRGQPGLAGLRMPRARVPNAARWQADIAAGESELVALAQQGRERVAWWWGARAGRDGFGAWCYLCDRRIVTWSRRWPPTRTAIRAVMEHRTMHLQELRPPAAP